MPESLSIKRCAIYSRSAVEKDNHEPFDSVSAQFMACAEFIGSQIGKGWRLVDTIYRDRGYSGSHLRCAGFRSLLNNIKLGLIDVSHHVGRLATHIIISFAEFEREIVDQRVKEKRAATLEYGRWQGTSCPLGYVVKDDCLVVEQVEQLAILAFDAWLVADTLYPLVIAGYRVATAALFILPTVSKYIRSPSKKTFENGDLLFWRIGV